MKLTAKRETDKDEKGYWMITQQNENDDLFCTLTDNEMQDFLKSIICYDEAGRRMVRELVYLSR